VRHRASTRSTSCCALVRADVSRSVSPQARTTSPIRTRTPSMRAGAGHAPTAATRRYPRRAPSPVPSSSNGAAERGATRFGQVRVARRALDRAVPEQDLHGAQVRPHLQQVGGEGVAQQVRIDTELEPGPRRRPAHGDVHRVAVQCALARTAPEERGPLGTVESPVRAQRLERLERERQDAIVARHRCRARARPCAGCRCPRAATPAAPRCAARYRRGA